MSTNAKASRPKPRVPPRTFVTVTVDTAALQSEWSCWPELKNKLAKRKFKRYHAYVSWSEALAFPVTGGERQVDLIRLALVGPAPPEKPGLVDDYIFEVDKGGPGAYCHPLAFPSSRTSPSAAQPEGPRTPLQVAGPPLTTLNVASACMHTGRTFDVLATSVIHSSEKQWTIANLKEGTRLDESVFGDENKIRDFDWEWRHDPERADNIPPMYEHVFEDGTQLVHFEGVDPKRPHIAGYKVPVVVSFDLDAQETIEDPAEFKKEVLTIRRMLYWTERTALGLPPLERFVTIYDYPREEPEERKKREAAGLRPIKMARMFTQEVKEDEEVDPDLAKIQKESAVAVMKRTWLQVTSSDLVVGLLAGVAIASAAGAVAFRLARRT